MGDLYDARADRRARARVRACEYVYVGRGGGGGGGGCQSHRKMSINRTF